MIPQWRGEPIEDKSLLVWTDQGLGDSIMLARYLPMIRARRVVLYCDAALLRLMRHSLPAVEVLMKGWAFPRTDLHVPMMSLMQCFGLENESEIPQGAYLKAPQKDFRIYPRTGLLAGVNWQGNKTMVRDFTRSMPFEMFRPLLDVEGVQFVSLQKGNAQLDIESAPFVIDEMDECHDLCDTASLMAHLDLVITTDTVIPHLAGALGKEVWLMEAYESEWRWGLADTSPWYENVRIFRQERPGDWEGVISKVRNELRRRQDQENARSHPRRAAHL